MKRLTGMDATFLYMETPSQPMHVGAVTILDPSSMKGGYSFDKFRDLVESRLHLLPPFRRRLVFTPLALHHPVWIEDPGFDLDFHIRRAAIPGPGTVDQLAEFTADTMARPFDRTKPMWRIWVVEGLQDGKIAMVCKVHHAAIDGVSGAELLVALLDLENEPAPSPNPTPDWKPERLPSDLAMLGRAMVELAPYPRRMLKALRRTVELTLSLREHHREPDAPPPASPFFHAPRTSFNAAITPHRSVAFAQVPLGEVKRLKASLGCTVNDLVLTVCAGALRSYLSEIGELPDEPLIATVPISVRTADERGALGNRVSAMFAALATQLDDPLARLESIRESTVAAKEQHELIGADMLTDWAEFAAPAIFARAARLYSQLKLADVHRPIHNLVMSNVPGPQFPLYCAGATLTALYPLGPISEGAGLNITVMSYMGNLYFGLLGCRELLPDLDRLAAGMVPALQELAAAADRAATVTSITERRASARSRGAGPATKATTAATRAAPTAGARKAGTPKVSTASPRDAKASTASPRDAKASTASPRDAKASTASPRDAKASTASPRDAKASTASPRDANASAQKAPARKAAARTKPAASKAPGAAKSTAPRPATKPRKAASS